MIKMVPDSEKLKIFKTGRKAGSSFNQRQVKEDGMRKDIAIG